MADAPESTPRQIVGPRPGKVQVVTLEFADGHSERYRVTESVVRVLRSNRNTEPLRMNLEVAAVLDTEQSVSGASGPAPAVASTPAGGDGQQVLQPPQG